MVILAALLTVLVPISLSLWAFTILSFTYFGDSSGFRPISPWKWLFSILIPLYMASGGLRRKSVNQSGAVVGFLIGFILILSNYSFFCALAAFFIVSSKATKYRAGMKKSIFEGVEENTEGKRNWIQVIANGGIATYFSLLYTISTGFQERILNFSNDYNATWLSMAVMSAIACCSGDTLASEIGSVLGPPQPVLITTWSKVPKGTNGAISLVGLVASLFGGLVVGLAFYAGLFLSLTLPSQTDIPPQWPVIFFGAVAGLLGSLIDSLLGATLQYSGFCEEKHVVVDFPSDSTKHISGVPILDNHGVNMFASLFTALIMPSIALAYWPFPE
ncbi:transmembrane protein 19-like [Anneissia japonica]|uniref:transmembrane protein 19-like n=1 Tax=Anneissia japonica TaxID=1529436 RepID=UPI001425B6A8|nr:transmembrane protein 19-like [Anneissia japonica]